MKKIYSKKKLAEAILTSNVDIFIPPDMLMDDLDHLYKIKRIIKKIMNGNEPDRNVLRNLVIISNNIFHNHIIDIINLIMSDDELYVLKKELNEMKF
jgi:hypothetical protein